MSEGVMQQNPDGTWTWAEPLGWQGPDEQVDLEVYRASARPRWRAEAYNRADHLGTVTAGSRVGIVLRAAWRFRGSPRTYLWDGS